MSDPHAAALGLLLLEDSPADSRLLVESLRDAVSSGQVVVQTVRRLADALRELKRMRFSCVLVDLGLPDGEGVAHVRRIREADPGVAIIVLTGLGDQQAADEAFRLGAQDYLLKGQYWGDELLQVIRRAIAKNGGADAPPGAAARTAQATFQPWVDVTRGSFAGVFVRPAARARRPGKARSRSGRRCRCGTCRLRCPRRRPTLRRTCCPDTRFACVSRRAASTMPPRSSGSSACGRAAPRCGSRAGGRAAPTSNP